MIDFFLMLAIAGDPPPGTGWALTTDPGCAETCPTDPETDPCVQRCGVVGCTESPNSCPFSTGPFGGQFNCIDGECQCDVYGTQSHECWTREAIIETCSGTTRYEHTADEYNCTACNCGGYAGSCVDLYPLECLNDFNVPNSSAGTCNTPTSSPVPAGSLGACTGGCESCVGGEIVCEQLDEVCNNATDDNCDGLIDCDDPACVNNGLTEVCDNGIDDNCNEDADNCDVQCSTAEICDDGIDQDCDIDPSDDTDRTECVEPPGNGGAGGACEDRCPRCTNDPSIS